MKIKSKILMIILIFVLSLSLNNIANAYSLGASITADKLLTPGTEISVSLKINDLAIGDGIDSFLGTLEYDTNVFETLSNDSFVVTSGWTPLYNPASNIFSLLNNSKVKTESTLTVIKFKVKSSITASNTTIKVKNMMASGGAVVDGGTGDINLSDISLTISSPTTQPTIAINKTYDDSKNTVTVKATSDRKMTDSKVSAGWILSADGLIYTKEFDKNGNFNELFNFEDGTSLTKDIEITEIKASNESNTNSGNSDNTVKPVNALPATGITKNIILIASLIIISALGFISYKKSKI